MTFSTPSTLQFANDSVSLKFSGEPPPRNPFCRHSLDKAPLQPLPSLRSRRRVLRAGVAPHHSIHFSPSPLSSDTKIITVAIRFPPAPYESFPLDDAPAIIVGNIRSYVKTNDTLPPL
ncbi:Hypothetical protein, putative [Bodo saltans]|uniref:Uncharacterized protein n=1 Tax=Bodo saltans TaxID=75058 RepID=A0A0S4J1Y3_BODSA|nr:Hypothetical protein, putative [Bodo saltans]|eukprot:CUG83813.1 Hypothetical protein, putative [Bodo saltans]